MLVLVDNEIDCLGCFGCLVVFGDVFHYVGSYLYWLAISVVPARLGGPQYSGLSTLVCVWRCNQGSHLQISTTTESLIVNIIGSGIAKQLN